MSSPSLSEVELLNNLMLKIVTKIERTRNMPPSRASLHGNFVLSTINSDLSE